MDNNKLDTVMNEIRTVIAVKRKFNKITQQEVADRSGISVNFIGEYERGKIKEISLSNAIKLIDSLDALDEVYNCLRAALNK